MSLSVVLLVLASALAHATWNAILKRTKDPENAIVGMMGVAALVGLVIAFFLRMKMPEPKVLGLIFASGVLEAGYFIALARALSRAPLSSVYTVVRGGALLLVWPVSVSLLGEKVTVERIAGTVLVMIGLAATSFADRSSNAAVVTEESQKIRSGLIVAAVCAFFVGGYHLAYKLALSSGGAPEAVNSLSLSFAVMINLILLKSDRRPLVLRAMRAEPLKTLLGGVLGAVGFLIFLFAMKNEGAGVVLTLRNVSILFAQAMGFLLGERPKRLSLIGAALVTIGAVLLSRG